MKSEIIKTYCGSCQKETNQTIEYKNHEVEPLEVLAKNDKSFETKSFWMVGFNIWQISKCNGCEKLTFKHILKTERDKSKDIVFQFPKEYTRKIPEWYRKLPIKYLEILKEVYFSINVGSFILALIGIRTLLDIYIVDKIGDVGTFKQKLNKLVEKGIITKSKLNSLHTTINAGNASAHRGYKPTKEVLLKLIDVVDNLLESEIIDKESILIKNKIPLRK